MISPEQGAAHDLKCIGQEVKTLVDEVQEAGYISVEWNASGFASAVSSGGGYASGVYFYRMYAISVADPTRSFTRVRKLLLLR